MTNTPKIFVVIVTYNATHWIDKCFSSLRRSILPLIPVVVDNKSRDSTLACLRCNYPEVILLNNDRNLGFGQANNRGIRYALDHGADYVFLLNQDAWIFEDTLTNLIDAYSPDYGILGPVHLEKTERNLEPNFCGFLTDAFLLGFAGNTLTGHPAKIYDLPFTSAAAWLLSRHTLEKIGGFDPMFYHYGEDNDYCSRVLYHGLKIGIVPAAKICHDTKRNGHLTFPGQAERQLKLHYTDINLTEEEVEQYWNYSRKKLFKKLWTFRFKLFKRQKTMYDMIKKEMPRIKEHRAIHATPGKHWL